MNELFMSLDDRSERKNKFFSDPRVYAAGLALSVAVLAGCSTPENNDTQLKTHQSSEPISPEIELDVSKNIELTKIINEANNSEFPVTRLTDMKYRRFGSFEFNQNTKNSVHIFQVGGELSTGEVSASHIKKMEQIYRLYENFAATNSYFNIPFIEVNEAQQIVSRRTAKAEVRPKSKDVFLFLVPEKVDIGYLELSGIRIPNTFTHTGKEAIASFVRPDFLGGNEGFMVEACQAIINSSISNAEEFSDIDQAKHNKITAVTQEIICNSLGKALYDISTGLSYDEYKAVRSNDASGRTNDPSLNNSAFYTIMPYIGNRSIYSGLLNDIPSDVGNYYVYQ